MLQSTSELVTGMEHSLAWRPEGSIIASTQAGKEVIFFERNGLRRYDFELREQSPVQIKGLRWNADSRVLAVWMDDKVGLWTRNNYHWYLKREIHPLGGGRLTGVEWHPERPLELCLATEREYQLFSLIYASGS
jgi:elongator complex protein 1